jgi:predicted DCC family thiol-disulfide oxidoreductase YuxK
MSEQPIVLFDGDCLFCMRSVQFIVARDHRKQFRFAALASEAGRRLLANHGIAHSLDSVVLIMGQRVWTRSSAALRIAGRLCFPWWLLVGFLMIPRLIRDWVYDQFAQRRKTWFGTTESCSLPNPEIRDRMINT